MSRQFHLSIPSMKCGHCANAILMALEESDCIHSFSIDLENKTALINADAIDTDIMNIIRSAGHEAHITE